MRSFVKIKDETEEKLHLVKEPGLYCFALLTACTAIGYGAASFSDDSFLWQAVYVTFGVFVGLACMDDYEECILNKADKDVRLIKQTIWDKMISLFSSVAKSVVVLSIDEIINVRVKEDTVTYFGKGYQITFFMNSGMEIGVTESFTFGRNSSEYDQLAEKIRMFLGLNQQINDLINDSSSDEEDGFEHITEQIIKEELDAEDKPEEVTDGEDKTEEVTEEDKNNLS